MLLLSDFDSTEMLTLNKPTLPYEIIKLKFDFEIDTILPYIRNFAETFNSLSETNTLSCTLFWRLTMVFYWAYNYFDPIFYGHNLVRDVNMDAILNAYNETKVCLLI